MSAQTKRAASSRIWNIIKVILALVLAAYVLSRTELSHLLELRSQVRIGWMAAVILLYGLLTALRAVQYHLLIGRASSYAQVLNVVVVQNAATNFVANSAGLASYLTLLRVEQGIQLSRAGLAFLLTKIWDLVAVWLLLLVASFFVWPLVDDLHALIVIVLALIGALILVFLLAVFYRQKFMLALRRFLEWSRLGRIPLASKAMEVLQNLTEQEQGFTLRIMWIAMFYAVLRLAVTMAWVYASLSAFSFEIGLLPIAFVNVLMQLISYLPIQVFGGLGITETTALYFYDFFGVEHAQLAAVLIGNRLLFYVTNLAMLAYLPLHAFFLNRQPGGSDQNGPKSKITGNEHAEREAN